MSTFQDNYMCHERLTPIVNLSLDFASPKCGFGSDLGIFFAFQGLSVSWPAEPDAHAAIAASRHP